MQDKATIFTFSSYNFKPHQKRILFHYKTEFSATSKKKPLFFTETLLLPTTPNLDNIPKPILDKLLESLHIILGISYYKFYCATKVSLPYSLSKTEAEFWNIVYKKGLGEFFYKNKLNPKISPKFPFNKNLKPKSYSLATTKSRCLVGIGGGKDSIVVAQLLREQKQNLDAFFVKTDESSQVIENIIKTIGIKNIKLQRLLDSKIHLPHQYNGHIPISAIYAFLGLLTAVLYDYSYIIVGNEHSSNFGNITYKGLDINHQWSKSYEFETLFQNYVRNSITADIIYFSLLRALHEIRIVKLFSTYKKYFPYFSSCNKNFIINKKNPGKLWCGQCPKCVFVFILLSAFLSKKALLNIFGKNLYEDKNLLQLFKDVLGFGTMKPFDCVGTFQEAQTALFLAKRKFADSFIVRQVGHQAQYYPAVFQTNKDTHIPEQFRFLGMENALIAGFGKEGKTTKQYLKKQYPKLRLGIADIIKEGSDYLKQQTNFDIAIKTPGIKKDLITIPYTTATNIFFSKIKNRNLIIGVTGSKGKSTTSTLIYQILKTSGKNVRLLGNIGTPMLQDLLKPIHKDTIFVLELSSAQLDDITFSPDIAVVTNLFPEHMDYHGNLENYYQAKKNIIRYQDKNDYFIYDPKNKKMSGWLKNYQGSAIPFVKNISLENREIPLRGQHNNNNIRAAIAVANILDIPREAVKTAIKNFKSLPHRLEFVGQFKHILFYDDAISTTPESTIMAIKSLPNIGTLFLGGTNRGYNFNLLEKTIKKYAIKNIVLFPESGHQMFKNNTDLNILKIPEKISGKAAMRQAIKFAWQHTPEGSICLLSCASPSYSLWKNFEEKGNQFKEMIKKYASTH